MQTGLEQTKVDMYKSEWDCIRSRLPESTTPRSRTPRRDRYRQVSGSRRSHIASAIATRLSWPDVVDQPTVIGPEAKSLPKPSRHHSLPEENGAGVGHEEHDGAKMEMESLIGLSPVMQDHLKHLVAGLTA